MQAFHLGVAATVFTIATMGAAGEPGHPAFERVKSLEGTWVGPAVWEQDGKKDGVEFEISYRVTSGGQAVMETMLPGTPGEMVTMYHLDGDDLVLVHYCTSGNQPRMKLDAPGDSNALAFRCLGGTNMTEADSHMHSVRITFVDRDRIKGAWSSVKGEVVEWVAEADLTRKR